jgi:lipoprotein-releasing system permease protein
LSLASEIAIRYLRRRPSRLVSRVSMMAAAGVALGVLAMVIAMGLMTGYRQEIQEKLIGANAEVVVFPLASRGIEDPAALERRLAALPRVAATSAVLYGQGMASSEVAPAGVPVVVKGIDPDSEGRVAAIDRELGDSSRFLAPGPDGRAGCAVGDDLARRLGLTVGSTIQLALPDASRQGRGFSVRRRAFRVNRVFRTNFYEYDSSWIFVRRDAAQALSGMAAPANVLEVKLDTIENTGEATARIREILGDGYTVTDWRSINGSLFSALTVQKRTLFLLIGLIVAVSTFNIVATLVMNVREKQRDIGVLSALGAPPALASRIFLRLGLLLGGIGVAAGLALGAAVCAVLTRWRLVSFPPEIAEVYFVSFVPFVVRARDLAGIALYSAGVLALACLLPARRAARLDVAEALRYE